MARRPGRHFLFGVAMGGASTPRKSRSPERESLKARCIVIVKFALFAAQFASCARAHTLLTPTLSFFSLTLEHF